jgi:hypothetical protein
MQLHCCICCLHSMVTNCNPYSVLCSHCLVEHMFACQVSFDNIDRSCCQHEAIMLPLGWLSMCQQSSCIELPPIHNIGPGRQDDLILCSLARINALAQLIVRLQRTCKGSRWSCQGRRLWWSGCEHMQDKQCMLVHCHTVPGIRLAVLPRQPAGVNVTAHP